MQVERKRESEMECTIARVDVTRNLFLFLSRLRFLQIFIRWFRLAIKPRKSYINQCQMRFELVRNGARGAKRTEKIIFSMQIDFR